jgi:sec-independent protein translocase protein TatB
MFDFAWSEIALIGVVALVLIGPKDMPVAVKAVANTIKKARRMAAEFQSHVDEMVRDTELAEIRQQIDEIRNFDIRGEVERAVDADGSLRKAFEDPFVTPPTAVPEISAEPADGIALGEPEVAAVTAAPEEDPALTAAAEPAPAFIPPAIAHAVPPPAFIPPGAAEPDGGIARPPFA